MKVKIPQIVALGGGGFSMERDGGALDDYVLSLTDAARPRVCFLPTASGDADHYVVRFYRRFSGSCDASHVSLFRRDHGAGPGRVPHVDEQQWPPYLMELTQPPGGRVEACDVGHASETLSTPGTHRSQSAPARAIRTSSTPSASLPPSRSLCSTAGSCRSGR